MASDPGRLPPHRPHGRIAAAAPRTLARAAGAAGGNGAEPRSCSRVPPASDRRPDRASKKRCQKAAKVRDDEGILDD